MASAGGGAGIVGPVAIPRGPSSRTAGMWGVAIRARINEGTDTTPRSVMPASTDRTTRDEDGSLLFIVLSRECRARMAGFERGYGRRRPLIPLAGLDTGGARRFLSR